MNGLKLTRIHFDNMENKLERARSADEVAIFVDSVNGEEFKTAYTKIAEFLKAEPPTNHYIGWDYEIYPKYQIQKVKLK